MTEQISAMLMTLLRKENKKEELKTPAPYTKLTEMAIPNGFQNFDILAILVYYIFYRETCVARDLNWNKLCILQQNIINQ